MLRSQNQTDFPLVTTANYSDDEIPTLILFPPKQLNDQFDAKTETFFHVSSLLPVHSHQLWFSHAPMESISANHAGNERRGCDQSQIHSLQLRIKSCASVAPAYRNLKIALLHNSIGVTNFLLSLCAVLFFPPSHRDI